MAVALALLAACTGAGSGGNPPAPTGTTARPDTIRSVARELAVQDRIHRIPAYRTALGQLHRRCASRSPASLGHLVDRAYTTLARRHLAGATRLALMRSMAAGVVPPGGGDACTARDRALLAETAPLAHRHPYGGYGAGLTQWDAVHPADPAHAGGYRPRLPDGRDSLLVERTSPVTGVVRQFDPPLSQTVALATIREQLLPPKLTSVYYLHTAQCVEQIYTNAVLQRSLGSSFDGVMIELTSGRGVSSHYDSALVDRAQMSVGTRRGGVSCG